MDIKELGIPDPIIDTNPAFEIHPAEPMSRHHDVLWWTATGMSVLMLCAWMAASLAG